MDVELADQSPSPIGRAVCRDLNKISKEKAHYRGRKVGFCELWNWSKQSGIRNTDGLLAHRRASSPQTGYFI